MTNEVVSVRNITKIFSKTDSNSLFNFIHNEESTKLVALDNVSFSAYSGELLGIIGLNGSGKTTLLRIISGIYLPNSGHVEVKGSLAPLLQIGTGFQGEYIAKENILTFGLFMGLSKSAIEKKVDSILDFAELNDFKDMKLKNYSAGMRARLGFSTALQINPDILLVDEVLSVGDAAFREKSFDAFLSFKKQGKTILYTTHNLNTISQLCDRVVLLNHGKVVSVGKPGDVLVEYKKIIAQKTK